MYLWQFHTNRLYYLLYYIGKSINYGILEGLAEHTFMNPYSESLKSLAEDYANI